MMLVHTLTLYWDYKNCTPSYFKLYLTNLDISCGIRSLGHKGQGGCFHHASAKIITFKFHHENDSEHSTACLPHSMTKARSLSSVSEKSYYFLWVYLHKWRNNRNGTKKKQKTWEDNTLQERKTA